MFKEFEIGYANERVFINFLKYNNGNNALRLYCCQDNMPYAMCSINVDEKLSKDEIAIKNWSENTGMEEVLMSVGIIKEKVKNINNGYVTIPVYKLSQEVLSFLV